MSTVPGPTLRSAFRRRILGPILLVTFASLGGILWFFLGAAQDGPRPDRLVEATPLLPPSPLPPLVPGLLHVGDARRAPEGWWVLDRRSRLVHLLDGDLRIVRSFGGTGDAPGEFRMPAALGFRGDSLVVLDAGEVPVLHLFGPDDSLVRREFVRVTGCDGFLSTGILEAPIEPIHLLGNCNRLFPVPGSRSVLVRVEDGGNGQVVGGERRFVELGLSGAQTAVGAGRGATAWVGTSSHPCLDLVTMASPEAESESLCMAEWVGVRFSVAELAARMGRGARSARLAEVVGPMEWLPVMDRVFPHPEGVVLRRLSGLTVRDLVHLRPDGSTTTLWSGLPEASWVGGDEVLIAWDGVEGMHVEIRSLHGNPQSRAAAR